MVLAALGAQLAVCMGPALAAIPEPRFAPYQQYDVGSSPEGVALGDFNGDGRADVVTATGGSVPWPTNHKLFVFTVGSQGEFHRTAMLDTDLTVSNRSWPGLAAGDLDGDGHSDVALATDKGIDVYLQRDGALGERTLLGPAGAHQLEIADLDSDGLVDMVVTGTSGVAWLRGLGGGTFASGIALGVPQAEIEVGDVTGDGRLDVVGSSSPESTLRVWPGRADGGLGPSTDYPASAAVGLALGDFTGDGRSDVAATAGPTVMVYPQLPDGTLGTRRTYGNFPNMKSVEAADLNADGRLDLIVLHDTWEAVGAFIQQRDGTMSQEHRFPVPYSSVLNLKGLAVGDVTGDGLPDAVFGLQNTLSVLAGLPPAGTPRVVRGAGLNHVGQLGDSSAVNRTPPVLSADAAANPDGVAAGFFHSLAVSGVGTVRAWGWNALGQLGDRSTVDRQTPVAVPGLTGVVAVAAGGYHSLALKADGTVWAWGWNVVGQLGSGTTDSSTPRLVPGLTGVAAVSAGGYHSLAVKTDGTVWAWGWNGAGQLGNGSAVDSGVPVQVPGLTGVVAVSAGLVHSLALRFDGTVRAWGWNLEGELGNGSTANSSSPVVVASLDHVVGISAGGLHSLAVTRYGDVVVWGSNAHGQIGPGSTEARLVPVVLLWEVAVSVSAGMIDSFAVTTKGRVLAWGWNGVGQLGVGDTVDRRVPTQLPLSQVKAVSAGPFHTLFATVT